MPGLLLVGGNGQVGHEIGGQAAGLSVACEVLTRAELDVTDRDAVLRAVERSMPAAVVNAAAYTAVDKAESDAGTAFAVNRDGPAHLAEACARGRIPLIHISTDYVYDGSKRDAYREDDAVAPLGVYGASKLAGENAIRERLPEHIVLRTSWVYGAHGHNFVKTMLRLGRERDTLRVVDDQRGTPTSAADLAGAILTLAGRLASGGFAADGYGTFHCAGQEAATWCGFAREIFAIAGPDLGREVHVEAITTEEFPTPARRPANSVLDCSKIADVHGIALRPWKDALRATIDRLRPLAG